MRSHRRICPNGHNCIDLRAAQCQRNPLLALGHNYIGTKHILLGLVGEKEGVAARVLSNLKVDANQVRKGVVELLNIESRKESPLPKRSWLAASTSSSSSGA